MTLQICMWALRGRLIFPHGSFLEVFSAIMAVRSLMSVAHTVALLDIKDIRGPSHTTMAPFIMWMLL